MERDRGEMKGDKERLSERQTEQDGIERITKETNTKKNILRSNRIYIETGIRSTEKKE